MAAEQQQTMVAVAGSSRFAAVCSLLRQYMKEQSSGTPTMGLTRGTELVAAVVPVEKIKKTMELFPPRASTLKDSSHERILEPRRAQLSIFYGGSTVVFDDFPADKTDELMQLANSFIAGAELMTTYVCVCSDVRVARNASLRRFLEMRASRLKAADPHPVRDTRKRKRKRKQNPVGGATP